LPDRADREITRPRLRRVLWRWETLPTVHPEAASRRLTVASDRLLGILGTMHGAPLDTKSPIGAALGNVVPGTGANLKTDPRAYRALAT
jgi:hypothetical protein